MNRVSAGIEITNIHNDVYGPEMEKPMQGRFTEHNVGGRQSRHVPLNDGTGIQHKCGVDGNQWYITTHSKADFLPFELLDDKSEQGFITLQFDAKQSISQQLSIAKSKLMDKRRQYYKEAWKDDEDLPSSRQNMHKIYENLQIMIAYDDMTIELGEIPTWEMVGSRLDMKPNTARDKFQKISKNVF